MNNDLNQNTTQVEQPVDVPQNNNSSNKNFIITIIVVIILVALASGGALYFITSNRNNNNNPNETLTDKDVEEYLTYVPFQYKDNVYEHESINVNEIDKLALLGMVLDKETGSYSDVDKLLKKMYNISLDNIKLENSDHLLQSPTGACYSYNNKGFSKDDCIGGMVKISIIEDYKVNDDELIITESAARDAGVGLIDMYSDYATDNIEGRTEEYFKQNKDEFTTYEHTFKKNDTGYYWYSTKVVKSGKTNSISLSDDELMEYVSYVPYELDERAYEHEKITIDEANKKGLLTMAISIENPNWSDDVSISTDAVDKNLKKMYNLSYSTVINNLDINNTLSSVSGLCYELNKDNGEYFSPNSCQNGYGIEHYIYNYSASNETIEIYEYAIQVDWTHTIVDYYTDFMDEFVLGEDTPTYADYINKNKDNLTLYKDTFKKNDTGYYWYSTEVVK